MVPSVTPSPSSPISQQPSVPSSAVIVATSSKASTVAIVSLSEQTTFAKQPKKTWAQHAITKIDSFEAMYVTPYKWLRPFALLQKKIDAWTTTIDKQIDRTDQAAKAKHKAGILDRKVDGSKIYRLAVFLARLPPRAARNIWNCIKGMLLIAVSAFIDPVGSTLKFARFIVRLVDELRKPETWTKLGAGVLGTALGQAAIGNPLSAIVAIIGASAMIAGLSFGALKAAIEAYYKHQAEGSQIAWKAARSAALENFIHQVVDIPEAMLTGFLMGLMIGSLESVKGDAGASLGIVDDIAIITPYIEP